MEKLSIAKCRKILNKKGKRFTDVEIEKIRDFLYNLGEIDYINFQNHLKKKREEAAENKNDKTE